MTVHAKAISSPLALPQTVRYYIERNPGNILIPLIPVDQLLLQPQGVPSQLSKQQISDENWKRVTTVTETAILLPAELLTSQATFTMTPTFPAYRAPDYNVKKTAAVQAPEQDSVPEVRPASIIEQRENKQQRHSTRKDEGLSTQLTHESVSISPVFQRSRATTTGLRCDRSSESMTQATTNNYDIPLRSAPLPDMVRDVIIRDTSKGITFEAHTETPRALYSRVDKGQSNAKDSTGDKLWLPGQRTSLTRTNYPPKTHCNHWIQYGECAYGDRCLYKHEMPAIDVLKKVTGFLRIPQWYKEQTAIQSRGPTWVERNMQSKKQNADNDDDTDMPGPREFPDPSTFKSLRREKEGVARQTMPANRVVQDLIDLNPPTLPVETVDRADLPLIVAQDLSAAPTLTEIEKKMDSPTILRRNSQISSSSDTTSSSQTARQRHKTKPSFKKAKSNSTSQPKWGLAASKYAPESERLVLDSCRTTGKARPRRHNKNPTREEGHLTENAGTGQRAAIKAFLL